MVKAAVQLDGWMGFETMQGVACGNLAMQEARGCRNMVYSPCRRHEAVVIWFILDKQGRQVSLSYPLFAPTSPRSVPHLSPKPPPTSLSPRRFVSSPTLETHRKDIDYSTSPQNRNRRHRNQLDQSLSFSQKNRN